MSHSTTLPHLEFTWFGVVDRSISLGHAQPHVLFPPVDRDKLKPLKSHFLGGRKGECLPASKTRWGRGGVNGPWVSETQGLSIH